MPELTDTQRFHNAFDEVMTAYEEAKATNGLIIQGDPVGPCKSNPRLVKPSLSDFIIDVELVLEALCPTDKQWGELNMVLCSALEPQWASKIKSPIGAEFLARDISPLPTYLKGIEVQRAA